MLTSLQIHQVIVFVQGGDEEHQDTYLLEQQTRSTNLNS